MLTIETKSHSERQTQKQKKATPSAALFLRSLLLAAAGARLAGTGAAALRPLRAAPGGKAPAGGKAAEGNEEETQAGKRGGV